MKLNRSVSNGIRNWCGGAAAALIVGFLGASTAAAQPYIFWDGDFTAGKVSQVALTNLQSNWVVAAMRNSSKNLELISYLGSPVLTRKSSITDSAVSAVSIADLDAGHVLTAVINSQGLLQLSVWSVSSTGKFTRESELVGGAASTVGVAAMSASEAVTVTTTSAGAPILSSYSISSTGAITAQATATDTHTVTQVGIASLGSNQLGLGARTTAGDLVVESWAVNFAGTILFQQEAAAGAISAIAVSSSGTNLTTAMRNGGKNLEVISWSVGPTGTITREMSNTAEAIDAPLAISGYFTAAENSSGLLTVGTWEVWGAFGQPASITKDAATAVAIAPLAPDTTFATASVNSAGDLEMNVFSYGTIQ